MEDSIKEFLNSEILGLDGLVNLANVLFLIAFSSRDVLKLRVMSLVSEGIILPYYYFQRETLWPPIFWGLAFTIVNAMRIVALASERRPVVFNDQEERLHRLAFSTVERREFLKFAALARWIDCAPGEVILRNGQQISDAIVLISGEMEAILGGTRIALRPGQLIGDSSAYSGLASQVDVVALNHATVAVWDLQHLREFTESRPELRAKLLQIMSADLAGKLREVAGAASGLAPQQIA